jgi:mono/diheme cytochrome c family protein
MRFLAFSAAVPSSAKDTSNMGATLALLVLLPVFAYAQGVPETVAQGEKVFNQTCATGYCHGSKGVAGGAPRLAVRGFDQTFIRSGDGQDHGRQFLEALVH